MLPIFCSQPVICEKTADFHFFKLKQEKTIVEKREIRVRFAPSPTGALHIGGIRTALYNYLFAKKHGGKFLLRIEDTDRTRYVEGAENYIIEALKWAGLTPDEGVSFGGDFGPYRQSDRKAIYAEYAQKLIENGHAYRAFDTPEELEAARAATENFTMNWKTRGQMVNQLTISETDLAARLEMGRPSVIRLKVEPGQVIVINDLIRGRVEIRSDELDDKVLLKADGMPTYHLANIVDDHLMQISHVIRGEEWLPSTAHHVLLYRGFGWEATMPEFCHLPLILKPVGNGKLSKRDGLKMGMPVFPLDWVGATPEESFMGFRGAGFVPEAMVNFLALLGWNPGTEQEIFTMEELIEQFDISKISKAGARFDYEKAKWFNQKYLSAMPNDQLAAVLKPMAEARGLRSDLPFLAKFGGAMKERAVFLDDFFRDGKFFFEIIEEFDRDMVAKKWFPMTAQIFADFSEKMAEIQPFEAAPLEELAKKLLAEVGLKPGDLLPLMRAALAGNMKGPGVFETMEVLGEAETRARLARASRVFSEKAD